MQKGGITGEGVVPMTRRNDKWLVQTWVDDDTYQQIEDAHWSRRITRADWLREAIEEKLARDGGDE